MSDHLETTVGLFRKTPKPAPPPSGPPGTRAYAIGDVHGRLDLLRDLLDQIDADSQARPCQREFIVFLGDLIDRGPDSRGVLQLLQTIRLNLPNPVFVMGNHEEMLLRVLGDDPERVWDWMSFGGYEFAQSYGVEVGRLATLPAAAAAAEIRAAMPPTDLAFVESFVDSFRFGDYLFVHAGIRPGTPLEQQKISDLRWIREDFLDSSACHPFVVVHGHTISDGPDERPNRIGIDTGAYASGVLTALCLEGTDRKYLTAVG
ncbi:hypothetical protein HMP06_3488 [Sphingomonas sp. HMP6]|nr:hypothetical protein HMP06_3488 [Sphingomonas sp. HMP6]